MSGKMRVEQRESLEVARKKELKRKRWFKEGSAFLTLFAVFSDFISTVLTQDEDNTTVEASSPYSIEQICKALHIYLRRNDLIRGDFCSIGICSPELNTIFDCRWFGLCQLAELVAREMVPSGERFLGTRANPWPERAHQQNRSTEAAGCYMHPLMGAVYSSREVCVPVARWYAEITEFPNHMRLPIYKIRDEIYRYIHRNLDRFSDPGNRALLCLTDDPLEKILSSRYVYRWEVEKRIVQAIAESNEPEGVE